MTLGGYYHLWEPLSGQAALPTLWASQYWLALGWGIVVGWMGLEMARAVTARNWFHAVLPWALFVWVVLPGPWGASFWLGLAFQAPSISLVSIGVLQLLRNLAPPAVVARLPVLKAEGPIVIGAIALGWLLLIDTLGFLPGSLFAWGFAAYAPAIAMALIATAWVFHRSREGCANAPIAMLAVLSFSVLRLPSGNLFDALTDPLLWIFLHISLYRRWKLRGIPQAT